MEEIKKNENNENNINSDTENPEVDHADSSSPAVEDEVTALKSEIERLKESLVRCHADMENLRKRTQKEKEESLKYANANFARDIVSICDNFQRALESIKDVDVPESMQAFVDGITLTEKEFISVLEKKWN